MTAAGLNPFFIRAFGSTEELMKEIRSEGLNPFFIRAFGSTRSNLNPNNPWLVLIPFSSGHSVQPDIIDTLGAKEIVLIPFSSGHSVQLKRPSRSGPRWRLNPFFIRAFGSTQEPVAVETAATS